jgi:hypothetical protein
VARSSLVPGILFSLFCAAGLWFGMRAYGKPVVWQFWSILGYFAVISTGLLLWQERSAGSDIKAFIRRFMAGMVIKLLLSLVVLFVLLRTLPQPLTSPFVVVFALLYLGFLAFSTGRLSVLIRKHQRP